MRRIEMRPDIVGVELLKRLKSELDALVMYYAYSVRIIYGVALIISALLMEQSNSYERFFSPSSCRVILTFARALFALKCSPRHFFHSHVHFRVAVNMKISLLPPRAMLVNRSRYTIARRARYFLRANESHGVEKELTGRGGEVRVTTHCRRHYSRLDASRV